MTTSTTIAIDNPPPDWTRLAHEILCPLCDYNLRGLVESRCPECGHRFAWQELLTTVKHPFLFEHRPRHGARSFLQTTLATLRPRRFWRELRPTHKPQLSRLLLYGLLVAVLSIGLAAPTVAISLADAHIRRNSLQSWLVNRLNNDPSRKQLMVQRYGSVQAYLTRMNPPVPSARPFLASALGGGNGWVNAIVLTSAVAVAWPWAALATLMIYRSSMLQRVRAVHVLRCTIYSADVLLVPLCLLVAWVITLVVPEPPMIYGLRLGSAAFLAGALLQLVLTYRLAVAYRSYLRFPHATATVLASQFILFLAWLKLICVLRL